MTRRIDWRKGATMADLAREESIAATIGDLKADLSHYSAERKRIISRNYQRVARAAKRRK